MLFPDNKHRPNNLCVLRLSTALTALKQHIGWRHCLILLGIFQASVIGCGLLLRPIVIKPEPEKEDSELDKDPLSPKELQAVYELENEQTTTSISSGVSQGSEDSGVTSLSTSNVDLRTAGAEDMGKEGQEPSMSTPPSPLSKDEEDQAEEAAGPPLPSSPKLLDFSVLNDGAFIWYSLFGLFATLGFFAPQLYIIELSKSRGVEPGMASYMLSVMAVAEIFGRLSIGVVLNKVRCRKTLVLLWCVVLLCLVLVAFTVVWEFWGLVVCCALYGYFMGTVGSTHIPMLAEEDVVGIQRMSSSVGVYVFIQSFAGLAGPPLGGTTFSLTPLLCNFICPLLPPKCCLFLPGVLVDVTGNYGAAFYSCAVGMGLSAICLALVGPAKSGMCQRCSKKGENMKGTDEEEQLSQDIDQPEFLEVDLVLEDSPVRQASDRHNTSVI